MTRRGALAALAGGLASSQAQARFRVYARCLPDHLARLAAESVARREAALAQLTSSGAIETRQRWVRDTFWRLAGGRPDATPLNLRTLASETRDGFGYKLEKIVYESRPGLVIPANVYVPTTGTPPYPGVLFQPGHSLNGKAADPYQKCCQALAMLGYVVLTLDPMGQGERTYYPESGGTNTRLGSADEEHSRPGRQMLLVGDTATRMQTWDAVRSLDVLASHPLVDPKRLASTGQSGGGTLTMMLAAVDDRLACAAVSCGNTENFATQHFNPPGSTDDAEQNFIGGSELGFERWDLLYPMAPKPLLVLASARDSFGTYSPSYIASGEAEFGRLKRVYGVLGAEDRVEWATTGLPHALSRPLRQRIYDFFAKHLGGRAAEEPGVMPVAEKQLWVGPTGNAVRDFASKRPLDLIRLPDRRESRLLAELLRIDMPVSAPKVHVLAKDRGEVSNIETIEIQTAPEVFVPGYHWVARQSTTDRPLLLIVEPRGRTARWREGELYPRLAAEGLSVCAFDVRGIGDLSPEVGRGNPYYTRPHSEEEAYAWASLMLGRPLLGQRVTDILHVASAMRGHTSRRCVLAALGHMSVPALCAAALDPLIDRVYLAGGLQSWASLLEEEDYKEPFANFVPGVLRHTDLPLIRAQLGTRIRNGTAWTVEALASL